MGPAAPQPTLQRLRQTLAGHRPELAPRLPARNGWLGSAAPIDGRSAAGLPAARCMNWPPRRRSISGPRAALAVAVAARASGGRGAGALDRDRFRGGRGRRTLWPRPRPVRAGLGAPAGAPRAEAGRCALGDGGGAALPRARLRHRRTDRRGRGGRSHRDAPPRARRARRRQRAELRPRPADPPPRHIDAERGGDPLGDRRRAEPARRLARRAAASAARASTFRFARTGAARPAVGSSSGTIMSVLSSRRYLSVWLRRLSTDRIERRSSAPVDAPRVVVASIKEAQRIAAMNDAAARLGLKTGMRLADARAMYPSLPVVEADFEADRRLLEAIADWCDRYTPLVGLDPPDGLLLDVTGCAHLFGGEAALARDLLTRLTQQGFARARRGRRHGRAAPGASRATAGRASSRAAKPKPRMLPLPIAALRVDAETVADLKTAGLTCVADLAIAAARAVRRALRQGAAAPPRSGARPCRRADHAAPAGAGGDGRAALSRADRARGRRARHHRASGAVSLPRCWSGAARADGCSRWRCFAPTAWCTGSRSAPARRCAIRARVRKLFEERLAVLGDACDPGFGYDMVRLSALVTERTDPAQTGLAGADHAEELAHLIDRLGARFGLAPRDAAGAAGHAYSGICGGGGAGACGRLPFALAACTGRSGAGLSFRRLVRCACLNGRNSSKPSPRCRTVRPCDFHWRRITHQVAQVEGPERIAMEWWRDDRGNKLTRDYFRVESQAGARVWLYREGLYGRETAAIRAGICTACLRER